MFPNLLVKPKTCAHTHRHPPTHTLTILRLPPGLEAVGGEGGDQVFDAVAGRVVQPLIIHLPGVTHKTLLLLLQREGGERENVSVL